MKIILISSIADREWAASLLPPLEEDEHRVDFITPDNAPRAIARSPESALLVVVSPESALGETADWLERIWQPFLMHNGTVIPCLVPDAPPGAKNWMPYDLYAQVPVDFSDPDALQYLLNRLAPKRPAQTPPPAPTIVDTPTIAASNTQPPSTDVTQHPPTITTASPVPPMPTMPPPPPRDDSPGNTPDSLQEAPQMNFFNYVLSIVSGFILVVLIWWAALQQTVPGGPSLLLWLGGLALVLGSLFGLGQIELMRRSRKRYIEQRYVQAQRYAKSDVKPNVYVEIVQSFRPEEVGLIWDMRGDSFTIGTKHDADVPLIAHTDLEALVAIIFYEDGLYYVENASRKMTLHLVDQQLASASTAVLNNGDLITLSSIILQFRVDVD